MQENRLDLSWKDEQSYFALTPVEVQEPLGDASVPDESATTASGEEAVVSGEFISDNADSLDDDAYEPAAGENDSIRVEDDSEDHNNDDLESPSYVEDLPEASPDETLRDEGSGEGWVLRIPKPKLRSSKGGRRSRRLVAIAALTGSLIGAVVMIAIGPVMKNPVGSQSVATRITEQPQLSSAPSELPAAVTEDSKRERQSTSQHRKPSGGRKQQKPARSVSKPKPKVSSAPVPVVVPVQRPRVLAPKVASSPVPVPRSSPQSFSENDDNPIDDWQK